MFIFLHGPRVMTERDDDGGGDGDEDNNRRIPIWFAIGGDDW